MFLFIYYTDSREKNCARHTKMAVRVILSILKLNQAKLVKRVE